MALKKFLVAAVFGITTATFVAAEVEVASTPAPAAADTTEEDVEEVPEMQELPGKEELADIMKDDNFSEMMRKEMEKMKDMPGMDGMNFDGLMGEDGNFDIEKLLAGLGDLGGKGGKGGKGKGKKPKSKKDKKKSKSKKAKGKKEKKAKKERPADDEL